ncbi:MAG TPA: MBL fold metallo-hydrolase [Gemmatimonadaceae bacterium]|nr:MBL fold metallo-hydrolase [Gemmatimonadaceae bacterium]
MTALGHFEQPLATTSSSAADSTVVVLLGTGTPVPDPRAAGPSTAIVVGKRLFIVDAGAGIERRLSAANLSNGNFEAVFFTHLHSDHVLGYPDLIFTSWLFGRSTPLHVYGPPGIQSMTNHLIAAFAEDIETRTTGYEQNTRTGYKVRARDVKPGVIYDSAGVRVTAFAVPHGTMKAYGYRFDTPTRSIVISGDTRESDAVARAATGVDVLVHEVVVVSELRDRPGAFGGNIRRYMTSFHTPANKLGEIAARANPKLLLLTHVVPTGVADSLVIAGIRSGGFKGRIAIGHDLERY